MFNNVEINKISLSMLKKSNRKPLYQEKPLIEEKKITKKFKDFYNQSLKNNQTKTFTPKNAKNLGEKFKQFYEDKIKWKSNVAQKNNERKLNKEQIFEEYIDTFSFKPSLNKNSINIISNKLEKEKNTEKIFNNNFYDNGIDKESLDKFKLRIKPIMNNMFNDNIYHKNLCHKKNNLLKRNLSEININPINNYFIEHTNNNSNNNIIINKTQKNRNEFKINYKMSEKKYCKQKPKDMNKQDKENSSFYRSPRDYYLWLKLKGIKKVNISELVLEDMYKVNIRPGTSCNYNMINEITKSEQIVEDFLKEKS